MFFLVLLVFGSLRLHTVVPQTASYSRGWCVCVCQLVAMRSSSYSTDGQPQVCVCVSVCVGWWLCGWGPVRRGGQPRGSCQASLSGMARAPLSWCLLACAATLFQAKERRRHSLVEVQVGGQVVVADGHLHLSFLVSLHSRHSRHSRSGSTAGAWQGRRTGSASRHAPPSAPALQAGRPCLACIPPPPPLQGTQGCRPGSRPHVCAAGGHAAVSCMHAPTCTSMKGSLRGLGTGSPMSCMQQGRAGLQLSATD